MVPAVWFLIGTATLGSGAQKPASIGWISDASSAAIPNRPAAGMIHGQAFKMETAEVTGGKPNPVLKGSQGHWTYFLKLRQGTNFFADRSFDVCIVTPPGKTPELRAYKVKPGDTFGQANPVLDGKTSYPPIQGVFIEWMEKGSSLPKTVMGGDKYSLNLSFGKLKGGRLPGQIYLCAEGGNRSYVAGTFTAIMKK